MEKDEQKDEQGEIIMGRFEWGPGTSFYIMPDNPKLPPPHPRGWTGEMGWERITVIQGKFHLRQDAPGKYKLIGIAGPQLDVSALGLVEELKGAIYRAFSNFLDLKTGGHL